MADVRSFTARPLSKQARSDLKDAFRIYLSSSSLAALRLRADDLCTLSSAEGSPKTAIAWTAVENIQSTVVQTSRALQDCYGIKIGEKVAITKIDGTLDDIESIILVDCSDPEKIEKHGPIADGEKSHWEWALEFPLLRSEVLATGLVFELELKGQRRSFRLVSIHAPGASPNRTIFRFTKNSKVSIGTEVQPREEPRSSIAVQSVGLGGLSRQIEDINESLSDFNLDPRRPAMPSFYEHNRGILLYGPKGTGKTALLRQIGSAGWKQVFRIGTSSLGRSTSESESKLRNIFQEAARAKPSVILIDQLDFIAPKRTSFESSSLVSVLCENLDAIQSGSVLVVAATRHPNNVDDALRTPHRLGTEIELQVPTAQDRAQILRAIRGPAFAGLNDDLIDFIAEKTHGYVGADLYALLLLICRKARQRQLIEQGSTILPAKPPSQEGDSSPSDLSDASNGEVCIDLDIRETDILASLQEVRPTAMREVFLETPKVRWSDIGGQHEIKKRLQQAVERPLKVSALLIELLPLLYIVFWNQANYHPSTLNECADST
jgi:AAA family ATPase